ncbi:MAG: XRE family transcriptional regulator [Pseudonocardiaceae bacterium]|nr:MAG: XRE family transcriptional regulator [Pseudonocardiaceae bacterium]
MAKDWTAVALAVNARMAERGISQKDLAAASGVSVAWLRRLQKAEPAERGGPHLAAVSSALGWPADHLAAVASGGAKSVVADPVAELRAEVVEVRDMLADVQTRLARLERSRQ